MSIPIIVCGKAETVGTKVIEGLKPDIEGMPAKYPQHYDKIAR